MATTIATGPAALAEEIYDAVEEARAAYARAVDLARALAARAEPASDEFPRLDGAVLNEAQTFAEMYGKGEFGSSEDHWQMMLKDARDLRDLVDLATSQRGGSESDGS